MVGSPIPESVIAGMAPPFTPAMIQAAATRPRTNPWIRQNDRMIRTAYSSELDDAELREIRQLMDLAFPGGFTDDDWEHTIGGWHAMIHERGRLLAQVAVVPRTLQVGEPRLNTGYVEGMATHPYHRRHGYASRLMTEANAHIRAEYELGALSDGTGIQGFYQQFGWLLWRGESFVDGPKGREPTPEDDGGILVLRTPATADLDLAAPIICDWRPGDVW